MYDRVCFYEYTTLLRNVPIMSFPKDHNIFCLGYRRFSSVLPSVNFLSITFVFCLHTFFLFRNFCHINNGDALFVNAPAISVDASALMSQLQPLLAKMQQDMQSYLQTQMEAQCFALAVTLQRLTAPIFPLKSWETLSRFENDSKLPRSSIRALSYALSNVYEQISSVHRQVYAPRAVPALCELPMWCVPISPAYLSKSVYPTL